jgi:hypothetical protein
VREHRVPIIVIQNFDLVFPEMARGAKVKVAGVFISEGAVFNLCPLTPVGCSIIVFLTEVVLGQGAKLFFQGGEGADFFKPVKKKILVDVSLSVVSYYTNFM